jgi:uncharacterized protein (TIGR03083 family)
MELTPRYGGEPVIRIDSLAEDPSVPLLRQRRRLADRLAGLDDEQWSAPSRCQDWSVQDVVTHLTTTNQFWALSISAGLDGTPTRYLAAFDPAATPAQLVQATPAATPAETLDQFVRSNRDLAASIAGLDDEGWSMPAEAPPGHLAVRLLALHALWDAWIHERDIALPLGLEPAEEGDEIAGALAYVAALGPALLVLSGSDRTGTLRLEVSDPDLRIAVEIGPTVVVHAGSADPADPAGRATATLAGDAVDLLEALSLRAPLTAAMADDDRWMLGCLAEVFAQPG